MTQADYMYEKMQMHLDVEQWISARAQGALILEKVDPHHVPTLLGMLMAEAHVYTPDRLKTSKVQLDSSPYYKLIMTHGGQKEQELVNHARLYIWGGKMLMSLISAKEKEKALFDSAAAYIDEIRADPARYDEELQDRANKVQGHLNMAMCNACNNMYNNKQGLFMLLERYAKYLCDEPLKTYRSLLAERQTKK